MTWRVARSLDVLLGQLNAAAPGRNKASDGSIGDPDHQSRDSDHNPWYQGHIVTARDFTHDPGDGADMHRMATELVASRDRRIKYVIWNRRIVSGAGGPSPWVWRPYSGTNPHASHLHLSAVASPLCDNTSRWNLSMLEGDDMPLSAEDLDKIEARADRVMRMGVRYTAHGNPDEAHNNDDVTPVNNTIGRVLDELAALRAKVDTLLSRPGGPGGTSPAEVADELHRRLAP